MAGADRSAAARTSILPAVPRSEHLDHSLGQVGAYAKRAGYELVAEYYDAAVSGADPIQDRPGFAALLDRIPGTVVALLGAALAARAINRTRKKESRS